MLRAILSSLFQRSELPHDAQVATPLLANILHNILLEIVTLVAIFGCCLGPTIAASLAVCVSARYTLVFVCGCGSGVCACVFACVPVSADAERVGQMCDRSAARRLKI